MTTYEFWREIESGDVWAVELEDDVVARCRGPLHWSEIDPRFFRAGYEYSVDEASVLESRRQAFERLDETTVILIARSAD